MDVSERIARTLERAKDPHALDTVTLYGDIGNLIVQYANNESVFLRMLGSLIGDAATADVVFFAHKNTQGRLDLLATLAVEKITEPALRISGPAQAFQKPRQNPKLLRSRSIRDDSQGGPRGRNRRHLR